MSTRANIKIVDKYSTLWFYRHSDGYPEGTLPTLEKFLQYVKDGKIRGNCSQGAGWLIIIGAEEYKNYQIPREGARWSDLSSVEAKKWEGKIPTEPRNWKVGAYEPTSGQHGDIEFLYTIDLEKMTITTEEV